MSEFIRTIGLDVGDVRIGVAVSDLLGITAQALEVIQVSTPEQDVAEVQRVVKETEATRIVVGLPLNQNGEVGPQAEKVLAFAEKLKEALGLEIATQDERFSTVAAERMLIGANVSRKKRKKVVDKVAAQGILQTFLDREKTQARLKNG